MMLSVAGSGLLLGACAAKMSKDECRTVDWRTVGYEDGVAGQPGNRIGEHRRACAEHGVTPDLNAYLAGRDRGPARILPATQWLSGGRERPHVLRHLSRRPRTNVRAGVRRGPRPLCTGTTGHGYRSRDRYRRREIRRLEDRVAESAFDVIDASATPEQRAQGVLDTKQAAERIGQLKAEITSLEQERARYQAELDAYRRTVAPR
jgi:hypothetical protein